MSSKLPSVTSPPWSTTTKRIVTVVILTLIVLFMRQVNQATWMAITVTIVLAYLLSPVVTFFEHRLSRVIPSYEIRRTLSVFLAWLFVLGLLSVFGVLIVPATVSQLRELADDLPDLIKSTENDLRSVLDKPITIGDFEFVPWQELENMFVPADESESGGNLTDTLQTAVRSLADPALSFVGGALSFLLTLSFVLVMIFYLMRDGPLFANYLVESAPESYRGDVARLLHELAQIWNAYLRGQVLLCLAVGLATYIAALILGLPQPLLLAAVAGFFEFIPNLGPALAQIPAVLFALTSSSTTIPWLGGGLMYAVVVSLTYIGIQNLEAIFLVPRILGNSLDLHPFVVLIAILIGASVAGVLGVVLAAPTVASLRLFGRYLRGKLLDEELFPTVPAYSRRRYAFVYRLTRFFLSKRFPVLPPDQLADMYNDAYASADDWYSEPTHGY
ncbi:MAG: AI-2E family transporter [Anaerolineae bacterium]|nr:AI-2E family transporter [Anaerolineae bacterium]